MKIAGFNISKKTLIGLGIIIVIIIISSLISSHNADMEKRRRIEEAEERARLAALNKATEAPEVEIDEEEMERQALIKAFGEPPEGFMWNDEGELYALSDDKKTAEEVVYTYLRSLSIQDFSTAQKYSKRSSVISRYKSFYDDDNVDSDYYSLFLRKQYKFAITSMEVLSSEDSAVLADGTTVVTMKLNLLDLTNKDFWKKDANELYKNMRIFGQTEDDDVKQDQYIYDYIYSKYEDGSVGKHEVVVSIKLDKKYGSGWLVADDSELVHNLLYEEGVNVAKDIDVNYAEWLENTIDKEADEAEAKAEAAERKKNR